MNVSEFIDSYSDDLIYIHEARSALLTHPLRGDYAFWEYLDASFCRILAVFMIGAIETMLESWRGRDRIGVLNKYFIKNVSNDERVDSLYAAFCKAGIQVDKQVFEDYLAIKYLRNTIVHGRWKEHEKKWLDSRGFPTDTRKLSKEHLDRIESAYQNMMFYIFRTSVTDPNAPKPAKLVKLAETVTQCADPTGILKFRDVNRIIWNNLGRIDAHIYTDIKKTVVAKRYDWTQRRSQVDLETLSPEECKRLFYFAARRAGEEGYEHLVRHRDLAKEALAFWREYWQRAVVSSGLNEGRIQRALQVFANPHFKPEIPEWSVFGIREVPERDARQLVESVLRGDEPFTSEQVADAFQAGKLAYKVIPNIIPVALFTVRLPIVDPADTIIYVGEATRAVQVFKLNRMWYECVECHRSFTDAGLNFYIQLGQEFAQRLCGPSG